MGKIMAEIKAEQMDMMDTENRPIMAGENEEEEESDGEQSQKEEQQQTDNIIQVVRHLLCIHRGKLEATFWSGGLDGIYIYIF
jgi:hypothetical protein